MAKLDIIEFRAGYAARTKYNAQAADLTVAFAVDFETAGERLTRKCAAHYLGLYLDGDKQGVLLLAACHAQRALSLNVAGNGIYTLAKHGWTQERVNQHVFDVLRYVHRNLPLVRIVCGGQTGADIAGAMAASALDIDCEITMPKGYIQRDAYGKDWPHTAQEIRAQVEEGVKHLRL